MGRVVGVKSYTCVVIIVSYLSNLTRHSVKLVPLSLHKYICESLKIFCAPSFSPTPPTPTHTQFRRPYQNPSLSQILPPRAWTVHTHRSVRWAKALATACIMIHMTWTPRTAVSVYFSELPELSTWCCWRFLSVMWLGAYTVPKETSPYARGCWYRSPFLWTNEECSTLCMTFGLLIDHCINPYIIMSVQ